MPIYEYACHGCRRKVSVFQRSMSATATVRCPQCGSEQLSRLVSSFAFHRSMPDLDDGADFDEDALMDGVDENDPASVARWARQMGERMGEDLPPGFDEELARMEAGEMPDDGFGGDDFDDFDE